MNNIVALFNTSTDPLSVIQNIEQQVGSENVKFKSHDNQVVINSPEYFYKIYMKNSQLDAFTKLVRQTLGEIYEEEYDLHWKVLERTDDNVTLQIEEREKVEVCQGYSETKLLEVLNDIIKKIETKFDNFNFIKQYLKKHLPIIYTRYDIHLIRDCIIKNLDYGITKDGRIILLDDADWKLVFVDKETSELSYVNIPTALIQYNNQDYYFCRYETDDDIKGLVYNDNGQRASFEFWLFGTDFDQIWRDVPKVTTSRFEYLKNLIMISSSSKQITQQKEKLLW